MDEIYLVLHCTGSYEDYREVALKAFSTVEKAQEIVDTMNIRKKRCDANREKQMLSDQAWRTANPHPIARRGYPKALPHFPGPQKSWTAEQKEKLRQTKAWNKKAEEELAEQNRAWHAAFMTRHEESLLGLSQEEREDLDSFDSDSTWTVEPIPFEE